MKNWTFAAAAFATAMVIVIVSRFIPNDYFFSAAYTVLQFIILATAWNILGGYTGYVNFGSAAFFATGAYSSVFLYKALHAPLVVMIVTGTLAAGLLGLAVGYLTLRMRGVFFAICVLGGMGSIWGTLLGAFVLGIAESFTSTFFGPSWAPAVSFGLLLAALAFKPSGLLGR